MNSNRKPSKCLSIDDLRKTKSVKEQFKMICDELKKEASVRYIVSYKRVSFWKCFRQWFHYIIRGRWIWQTNQPFYEPVYPGNPEYENAPYGVTLIWNKNHETQM